MKLVADEGIDRQIVERLRNDGHTIWYIAEESPSVSDDTVLMIAREQNSVLLTSDKDFGELVYRLGRATAGVILLRLMGISPSDKAEQVSLALHIHEDEMSRSFTVIGSRSTRIRHNLPD